MGKKKKNSANISHDNELKECEQFCGCDVKCKYFPEIEIHEGEYHFDNDKCCNVRNEQYNYVCQYDLHIIKSFNDKCPVKCGKEGK